MSKREFNNSIINGFIIDPIKQTFEPFEVETAYARSNNSAVARVRETLNLDDSVLITIKEIKNEKAKPKNYDNARIIERAVFVGSREECAENLTRDNQEIVAVKLYTYRAVIVSREMDKPYGEREYFTQTCEYETATKATKTHWGEYAASSNDFIGEPVSAFDVQRIERELFAVIDADELAACIVEKTEEQ